MAVYEDESHEKYCLIKYIRRMVQRRLDERIILRRIFRKWNVGHGMDLTQGRDRRRALVNVVVNVRVP